MGNRENKSGNTEKNAEKHAFSLAKKYNRALVKISSSKNMKELEENIKKSGIAKKQKRVNTY